MCSSDLSTFQAMTGYYTEDGSETSADLPERVKLAIVAPRFLPVLGVSPGDPVTWSAAVLTVLTVATVASLLPAVRAARLDPMQVLRDEN